MRSRDFKRTANRIGFALFTAAVLVSCAYVLFWLMENLTEIL